MLVCTYVYRTPHLPYRTRGKVLWMPCLVSKLPPLSAHGDSTPLDDEADVAFYEVPPGLPHPFDKLALWPEALLSLASAILPLAYTKYGTSARRYIREVGTSMSWVHPSAG